MRLAVIPPYQNPAVNWGFVLHDLVADLRKKGALEGIEVNVDEGSLEMIDVFRSIIGVKALYDEWEELDQRSQRGHQE